jgi:hypothetical protein
MTHSEVQADRLHRLIEIPRRETWRDWIPKSGSEAIPIKHEREYLARLTWQFAGIQMQRGYQ